MQNYHELSVYMNSISKWHYVHPNESIIYILEESTNDLSHRGVSTIIVGKNTGQKINQTL